MATKTNTARKTKTFCQDWCNGILKQHGRKILGEPSAEWTTEEVLHHHMYKFLSKGLTKELKLKDFNDERTRLIDKYGTKIIDEPTAQYTQEEAVAHNLYKAYTNIITDVAPEIFEPNREWELALKDTERRKTIFIKGLVVIAIIILLVVASNIIIHLYLPVHNTSIKPPLSSFERP